MPEYLQVQVPTADYLNSLMKKDSFIALWDLFKLAHAPAKEMTESYAALSKLKKYLKPGITIVHVGDGAHCRTAALFAFLTKTNNIAIDPVVNTKVIEDWKKEWNVERFHYFKSKVENICLDSLNPSILTFVHAHVDVDKILNSCSTWKLAYTLSCCLPSKQLSHNYPILKEGKDFCVLGHKREYQLIKSLGPNQ